ncbi:flagellar hook-length control protein FliK [Pseudomonas lini]|uniref:flagellar hook-length control protein FliK n=1 Tax=Pseudomonas lini TaxID=163011 RepID=UPI00277D59F4|nr:flagellar hook-length control protein FliK [Pseudomonas lini]MDQ0121352.1 flagellar hook-length control protein FliK [Pseudomonas lini]
MPVTPPVLVQAAAHSKAKAACANPPAQVAEPGAKASGFADVYANQARNTRYAVNDGPARPMREKVAQGPDKTDVSHDKAAAPKPAVADSGKSLPADKPATDDKVASEEANGADTPVTEAAVDPTLDPADPALGAQTSPGVDAVPPQGEQPMVVAMIAVVVTADTGFDPQADPLDALPAVRMAMEQSGHVCASSQAQPPALPTSAEAEADGEPAAAQNLVAGKASLLDVQAEKDSTEGGDKAFSGLLDDGLKDLSAASSDTRVDDFASRLAALTQAATPKTANAQPVNQPIAMHQSGWSEEVVNRVMYLSSANLKAADIQLQPAELGRLDIRVSMVPDQQTQVTFMSAHPVVREALDGQMHRLREMFAQQGMGQVDVNVSDQSRGSQQGQDQAQQSHGGRTSASGGRLDSMDDERAPAGAEASSSTTRVIGSSAVDYYA